MKRLSIIFLSASILSGSAFSIAQADVVATYKGGSVKDTDVMQQFKPALDVDPSTKDKKFEELGSELQETLVKGYVNFKLLEQEGAAQNIESLPEFKEKLNRHKAQLIQNELFDRYVKANISDKMVDAEYDKLAASLKGQDEIKASHILLDSEEKAKEVKTKLSKDSNKFKALAKEYSIDEGSKNNGGEVGFIMKGQPGIPTEFTDKAFAMKVGNTSDPVKTKFGWHIIKVLEKKPIKVPTKEEAKAGLYNKISREAIDKYLNDLANKSDIKITLPKKEEAKPAVPAAQ